MIQINITNTDISNSLRQLLKNNNPDIVALLSELISENHVASNYFISLVLGNKLPKPPKDNFMGFISIEKLKYNGMYDLVLASPYNQNGFIEVRVISFSGYTKYSPLRVQLPGDFGEYSVEIKDFRINPEGDPYDWDPVPF